MVRLLYEADYAHIILSSLYLRRPSRDKVQQTLPAIFHAVQVVCMRGVWKRGYFLPESYYVP